MVVGVAIRGCSERRVLAQLGLAVIACWRNADGSAGVGCRGVAS